MLLGLSSTVCLNCDLKFRTCPALQPWLPGHTTRCRCAQINDAFACEDLQSIIRIQRAGYSPHERFLRVSQNATACVHEGLLPLGLSLQATQARFRMPPSGFEILCGEEEICRQHEAGTFAPHKILQGYRQPHQYSIRSDEVYNSRLLYASCRYSWPPE